MNLLIFLSSAEDSESACRLGQELRMTEPVILDDYLSSYTHTEIGRDYK